MSLDMVIPFRTTAEPGDLPRLAMAGTVSKAVATGK